MNICAGNRIEIVLQESVTSLRNPENVHGLLFAFIILDYTSVYSIIFAKHAGQNLFRIKTRVTSEKMPLTEG
jgi:hypothetical protein